MRYFHQNFVKGAVGRRNLWNRERHTTGLSGSGAHDGDDGCDGIGINGINCVRWEAGYSVGFYATCHITHQPIENEC